MGNNWWTFLAGIAPFSVNFDNSGLILAWPEGPVIPPIPMDRVVFETLLKEEGKEFAFGLLGALMEAVYFDVPLEVVVSGQIYRLPFDRAALYAFGELIAARGHKSLTGYMAGLRAVGNQANAVDLLRKQVQALQHCYRIKNGRSAYEAAMAGTCFAGAAPRTAVRFNLDTGETVKY